MDKAGRYRVGVLVAEGALVCALLAFTRLPALNAPASVPASAPPVALPTIAAPSPAMEEAPRKRLDLNEADAWMLVAIPGVGEQTALRIVDYRDAHGGFCSVEELLNVEGIGEQKYEAILPFVRVGEEEYDE